MLSFHINTFFIVNEMCLPISVQDNMVNNKGKVWRNGKKVVSLHEKLKV